MSPRIASPMHPSQSGGAGAGRGRGRGARRDTELLGQTVRIREGPFKGTVLSLLVMQGCKSFYFFQIWRNIIGDILFYWFHKYVSNIPLSAYIPVEHHYSSL